MDPTSARWQKRLIRMSEKTEDLKNGAENSVHWNDSLKTFLNIRKELNIQVSEGHSALNSHDHKTPPPSQIIFKIKEVKHRYRNLKAVNCYKINKLLIQVISLEWQQTSQHKV